MSRIIKRRYVRVRQQFKRDLYERIKDNRPYAMMIVSTYSANQHRTHILKIWSLLGRYHKEAFQDYCDKLIGQHITGRDEFMRSLYFADKELYDKYVKKIPGSYAMGDALGVAYRVLNQS